MDATITVRGIVAGRPRHVVTAEGLAVTSFRLLAAPATRDRSWFIVRAVDRLAVSAAGSLTAGDAVLVAGRLVIREWGGTAPGAAAEIEAGAIGHDLGPTADLERDPGHERDPDLERDPGRGPGAGEPVPTIRGAPPDASSAKYR